MPPTLPTLTTGRLVLRPWRDDDLDDLVARRNDVGGTGFQNWTLPYTREDGEQFLAVRVDDGPGDPAVDGWTGLVVTDRRDGTAHGDVAAGFTSGSRNAEVGYTFARSSWGHGYATEATGALVAHLFDVVGVTRVGAGLHPGNVASARVLERLGFRWEGHTRLSFWVGDDNSDDLQYGLTRPEWDAWNARPSAPPDAVRLVDVTPDTVAAVRAIEVHGSQRASVASVVASLADAQVPPVVDGAPLVPWYRAIAADGDLVGFVMVARATPAHPDPRLWRLLVDRSHQRRGIGTAAVDHVVEQCRQWGAERLWVHHLDGPGSPGRFWRDRGFEPIDHLPDGRIRATLTL